MVDHPGEYRWSSFAYNAMGHANGLITPHELYQRLGGDSQERCQAYRQLLDAHIDGKQLDELRNATNKSWVLGSDKFKEQVEALTKRQAAPKTRGGDHKSKKYKKSKINRV